MPQCTAQSKRTGLQCQQTACEGSTKCRFHGGKSPGAPIKTGQFSKRYPSRALAERIERHLNDESPGDLLEELALLRSLLGAFIEKVNPGDESDPHVIGFVFNMVDSLGKLVERMNKMRNETALTEAEVTVMMVRIAGAVRKYIPNESDRLGFLREIGCPTTGLGGAG